MYIALRWLFGLSSAMWIAMCCLDIYLNRMSLVSPRDTILPLYQNYSLNTMQSEGTADTFISLPAQETTNYSYYHYFMFFTCSIMFIILQNNRNMNFIARILYAINKQSKMYFETLGLKLHLNKTAIQCWAAITKYATAVMEKIYKTILEKIDFYFTRQMHVASNSMNNNLLILKRFKELNEERRNLGKLLLTTIRDNKNIRMRYQLENLAKNRLTRYIEDTERLIKKNRCQYTDYDNGDTISRIRQYTVYCDKDCLLDYKSSSTIVNDYTTQNLGRFDDFKVKNINYPITRQRFLTGSEAFQKFLKCSGNIVQCSTTLTSSR
ncbi:uncharacterized protein LOC123708182 isoform X2 [Pieris brassicae]|uniref:uncharacterized protein LOC123708182 isoform X2 n=1 Tax=Pieris brassicae TaxID=7116 RepID=UPI001E65F454|nr:uncharacterized protein LOC123708182 isoform X2 [Pieris brassicae]